MPEADPACDAVVVGAGIVGLAIARALALRGLDVVCVERGPGPGRETTARNSEVVHGSLYYRPGSLKARWCAAGREALYAYCEARGIAHRRLGKYVVATRPEEVPTLAHYLANGREIGARGLELVDGAALAAAEPMVRGVAALWSPESGIVDAHGVVAALHGDLETAGGRLACRAQALSAEPATRGYDVLVDQDGTPLRLRATRLVNAAGHGACAFAARIGGLDPARVPVPRHARGRYYTLRGRSPFRHLVYPIAEPGGLGVHVTLDLAGRARFGPDVEWIEGEDYAFDDTARPRFVAAIARWWPAIRAEDLQPGYTGIRPRVARAGTLVDDFVVEYGADAGLPGLVNLYGIESPGLTAALALAEDVAGRLAQA